MNKLQCKMCNGNYVIRSGKYGLFAGCTNYPKCRSTMDLKNFVLEYICTNGLNIYKWDKVCWKCGKTTSIYSYYPVCDFTTINPTLAELYFRGIGIGDIEYFDKILMNNYPTIQMKYSNTIRMKYVANTCTYCKALQGRNYVVEDPHEIFNEIYSKDPYKDMDKYKIDNYICSKKDYIQQDIKSILEIEED